MLKKSNIRPGIHPDVTLLHFNDDEKYLIHNVFAPEFYITNSGYPISLGQTSNYRYLLLKFPNLYAEQFNIEREIVVLFSDYPLFEPRTLDAFEAIFKKHQDLRIEKICTFLVSKDNEIEKKISNLLSNSTENQVVVPFSYDELINMSDTFFFRNRIKNHFYSRDLFSYESPLRKDIYFFGRNEIVHDIVNRHKNNENSGLFGLRKVGKTSIIYAIERVLKATQGYSVYIDCQNTSFYLRRWNKALKYIVNEIKNQNKLEIQLLDESQYTEENASIAFEKDLKKIKRKIGNSGASCKTQQMKY